MSKKNFATILMALVAMSFFRPNTSLAQTESEKPFSPKIKTPETSKELLKDSSNSKPSSNVKEDEKEVAPIVPRSNAPQAAQRRLQQHGIGLGLGQTFLMGNYGKHGQDKITADILYSYAASYSFDLLVNAHMSDHKKNRDRMNLMGLTSSIKARWVEYDNFSPFILGGLGFYAPKAKRSGDWTEQKLTFGLNFGAGADLRLNEKFVVGLMGQMHWPFAVPQDDQTDLKGYYFKLLITGMYLF